MCVFVWVGAHLRSRLFVAACTLQWDAATIKEPIWKVAAPRAHHSTASSHAAAQMHEFDFISVWFLQPQPLIPISCHQSRREDSDFKNKSKNMRIRLDLASCITMQKPEIWFFFFVVLQAPKNVDSMSCWTSCHYAPLSVNMSVNLPVIRGGCVCECLSAPIFFNVSSWSVSANVSGRSGA